MVQKKTPKIIHLLQNPDCTQTIYCRRTILHISFTFAPLTTRLLFPYNTWLNIQIHKGTSSGMPYLYKNASSFSSKPYFLLYTKLYIIVFEWWEMVHFMNFFSSRFILNYSRPILKDKNPGNQQICKESKKTTPGRPKTSPCPWALNG
jgi:hypothetical protein